MPLTQPITIDYVHRTQRAGRGEFARVKIKFSPVATGTGFSYSTTIKTGGGDIPLGWLDKVEEGLRKVLSTEDVHAELFDTAYHEYDSSTLAFELAAIGAA